MKRIYSFAILTIIAAGLCSCNKFLEMPEVTGSVYLEDVFSTRKDAEGMLWRTYHKGLREGLPEGWGVNHGTLASISGELSRGFSWHGGYMICKDGPAFIPDVNGNYMIPANFDENWQVIRSAFLVIQNIDKVPSDELSEQMKSYMKGEAYGLIAYRYMGMLMRWGGVPIATKAYAMADDINLKRSSVQETIDYILQLCDKAYNLLPSNWYDIEPGVADKWEGRLTKGVALAIKAKTLMFAARPLFNSNQSYAKDYNMQGEANFKDEFICLQGYDKERYKAAIDANLAVLDWAAANGKHLVFTSGEGNVNSFEQAIADYGTGVSELNGPEILLAFKIASTQSVANNMNMGYNYSGYVYNEECAQRGLLTNFLRLYVDQDGNPIDWPVVGESSPRPIQDFADNIDKIEARFRVDFDVPGKFSRSNDGDALWNEGATYLGSFTTDEAQAAAMVRAVEGCGIGCPTKFFYNAGARSWFEFPLFRLAENYMYLAEAYNEYGEPSNALRYLNIIRNRAGLPSVAETNQAKLREIIVREDAVEFFEENHRYFDLKHWKHPQIDQIIGGDKTEISFLRAGSSNTMDALISYWDAFSFTQFWHPRWFLEPFKQGEVNKGLIAQNPGY